MDSRMSISGMSKVESAPTTSSLDSSNGDIESSVPGAKAGLTVTQFWIIMAGLNMSMLLSALDLNIVATAVPAISSEFDSYKNSTWLATGLFIAFAGCLPVYAKLSDAFGRKAIFILANVMFLLGSGLCGGARSMNMLIGARVLQGIGSGGIYGLTNVIITDLVPLRDVGKYVATTSVTWAVADVAGPLIGGSFAQHVSWRWIFWLNLIIGPFSLGICVLGLKLPAPAMSWKSRFSSIDYIGALLLTASTTCLLLGISWGGNDFPWNNSRVIGTLAGGAVGLVVFTIFEHQLQDPLLPISLMRSRTVLFVFLAQFFYGANLLGTMYYIPQFFQIAYGNSPTTAGVGLLPLMIGIACSGPASGWVTSRWGKSKINVVNGALLLILGSGLITRWDPSVSRAETVIILFIVGAGQGAIMSGLLLTGQVAVDPNDIAIVTGMAIFFQSTGDTFGIAGFGAILFNGLRTNLMGSSLDLSAEDIQRALQDAVGFKNSLRADMRQQFASVYATSMTDGWWLMFGCAVMVLLFALLMRQAKFEGQ